MIVKTGKSVKSVYRGNEVITYVYKGDSYIFGFPSWVSYMISTGKMKDDWAWRLANAKADSHIMDSIMGNRWLITDGLAWMQTNVKFESNDIIEIRGCFNTVDATRTGSCYLMGLNVGQTSQSWMNPNQILINDYHPDSSQDYSRFLIGPHKDEKIIEFPRRSAFTAKVDFGAKKKWINGTISTIATTWTGINMTSLFSYCNLPLFTTRINGGVPTNGGNIYGNKISYLSVLRNDKYEYFLVPCNYNGVNGMLDIVSGDWFGSETEGLFYIE